MKFHDQKQLGEDRILNLHFPNHLHIGQSRVELKLGANLEAGADGEAMEG